VASKSLEKWLKILWENWRMSTWCAESSCLSPLWLGGSPPLLSIKGEADYMRAALSSYVEKHDVLCCRVGGRPDDPRSGLAMMAYLVPEQWRFEGRRAENDGDVL
jgi:hypothetical protein